MARNKKQLPLLEKVTITDVAAEGKAIARVNDMVVFVPFVAPGDVIDIQLTRKKHSYAEGKAVFFHEYSPRRAEPFCEHFGVCGGCKWQHLPYEEQIRYKHKQVIDNLTRIGKIEMEEILPIKGSKHTTFYRNKLEFTFSNKKWLTEEEVKTGAKFDCMDARHSQMLVAERHIKPHPSGSQRILPDTQRLSVLRPSQSRRICAYINDPYGFNGRSDGSVGIFL